MWAGCAAAQGGNRHPAAQGVHKQAAAQGVNKQAAAVKEFSDRVQQYMALQKKLEAELPPLRETTDPAKISGHEMALAAKIRAARANARPGDIFTPRVAPQFRSIIRRDLRRRSGRDASATMEEVPRNVVLQVNATYPTAMPLATVPPILLANLQRLPDELEYRFYGRHLILRDVRANVIVDFILNALPSRL